MKHSSKAIVLSVEDFGEADCYVQFFTQKWGMISTLAKSAKKSKRRYIGGLDLFCHDEIYLRGEPTKDRAYLQELTVLNSFPGLRNELEKMLSAGKVAAWVKKLANVSSPLPQVYSLLGQTLSLLETETRIERYELLVLIFKLKLLSHLGLKPRMDSCIKCLTIEERPGTFDISQGGFVCIDCLPALGNENTRLSIQDRSFLDLTDELKLTLWDQFDFPLDRVHSLQRTLTQFASFHTHLKLPL